MALAKGKGEVALVPYWKGGHGPLPTSACHGAGWHTEQRVHQKGLPGVEAKSLRQQ